MQVRPLDNLLNRYFILVGPLLRRLYLWKLIILVSDVDGNLTTVLVLPWLLICLL